MFKVNNKEPLEFNDNMVTGKLSGGKLSGEKLPTGKLSCEKISVRKIAMHGYENC